MDRSPATLDQHLVIAPAMFKHFREQGYAVQALKAPRRDGQAQFEDRGRVGFTANEVRAILNHVAQYRLTQPAKFWVTAIAAFTGARLEEIVQLNLRTDLRRQPNDGVWYFDINTKHDPADSSATVRSKRVKTAASRRQVPIHSALVEIGLVDYLQTRLAAGFTRAFESEFSPHIDPESKEPKWSHKILKFGTTTLKKLAKDGLVDRVERKITFFHSWRHTMITTLALAGVSKEQRYALVGHSDGSVHEGYTHLNDVDFLSALIEKHLSRIADALRQATSDSSGTESVGKLTGSTEG